MVEVCETERIPRTDWSTAGEQGKLVFVVPTKPSLAQFISLFTTGKIDFRSTKLHINSSFSLQISVKKKRRKEIRFDKQICYVTSIQFVACALRENLSNRSSGVQILRDICTRFERYLYSTECSWIINTSY